MRFKKVYLGEDTDGKELFDVTDMTNFMNGQILGYNHFKRFPDTCFLSQREERITSGFFYEGQVGRALKSVGNRFSLQDLEAVA